MGRFAVETSMNFDKVSEIIVGDINADAAIAFADSMNDKVSGIGLDATDISALKTQMEKVDVVINTVGPFFKYGPPILEAALDTNCHYLDINDDWEPTLEMLKFHDKAESNAKTAILGMGASPGLTNMLGAAAIDELDEVETLYTGWTMDGATPQPWWQLARRWGLRSLHGQPRGGPLLHRTLGRCGTSAGTDLLLA